MICSDFPIWEVVRSLNEDVYVFVCLQVQKWLTAKEDTEIRGIIFPKNRHINNAYK